MRIILAKTGEASIVDDDCPAWILSVTWTRNRMGRQKKRWYFIHQKKGKYIYLHRLIAKAGPGEIVDHIDGNSLNNTRENLRIVTHSQNMWNSTSDFMGKESTFKGVCKLKSRWRAQIHFNKKQKYIGSFATEIEAAKAYNKAALAIHGKFARLNEIKELI